MMRHFNSHAIQPLLGFLQSGRLAHRVEPVRSAAVVRGQIPPLPATDRIRQPRQHASLIQWRSVGRWRRCRSQEPRLHRDHVARIHSHAVHHDQSLPTALRGTFPIATCFDVNALLVMTEIIHSSNLTLVKKNMLSDQDQFLLHCFVPY